MHTFFSNARVELISITFAAIGCMATTVTQAEEVVSRSGLDPAAQSKLIRVLARDRIGFKNSANPINSTKLNAAGSGSATSAQPTDCTTSIGNVNVKQNRSGVRLPREIITVIKAPVINKC